MIDRNLMVIKHVDIFERKCCVKVNNVARRACEAPLKYHAMFSFNTLENVSSRYEKYSLQRFKLSGVYNHV